MPKDGTHQSSTTNPVSLYTSVLRYTTGSVTVTRVNSTEELRSDQHPPGRALQLLSAEFARRRGRRGRLWEMRGGSKAWGEDVWVCRAHPAIQYVKGSSENGYKWYGEASDPGYILLSPDGPA